ncbi:MAG: 30S ribosomal protein S20 [Kordiimonas sp.]|nr:30S ribosomal protein S20 [Kordiimonas sp.]|tara:strand:+ start:737 stop:1003 length:267 start_codon:yes stop_codon:yes gene_type:complete
MANSLQAKKRIRINARKAAVNKVRRSRVRTFIKKVEAALEQGDAEAAKLALKAAEPEIMRGVSKGILHKNTASRKISRMNKRLKAIVA